jgi:peroxiredoxin
VQLQQRVADIEGAGTALFAVSYDSVEVLADFAAKHGITYPLLSDEGSRVIRELGLYNEHLAEQARYYGREARPDQYGVPYPGIFRLDAQGVVVARAFEQSYRVRPAPALLIEELAGAALAPLAVSQQAVREGVTITAGVDATTFRPYEKHELHVALEMAQGIHVYGKPVPEGLVAVEISVVPFDGLDIGDIVLPPPHPFRVAGIDDEFFVYEGTLTAVVPFDIVPTLESATISVQVRYQACTDMMCFPPDVVTLDLALQGADLIRD